MLKKRTMAAVAMLAPWLFGTASAQTALPPPSATSGTQVVGASMPVVMSGSKVVVMEPAKAGRHVMVMDPMKPAPTAQPTVIQHYGDCCGGCGKHCDTQWLKPWDCDDLEMKPVEHAKSCCGSGLDSLLWCPKEENGNGAEEEDLTPLMSAIQCNSPDLYEQLKCNGINIYGWVQAGFTANFDDPNDRINFGTNFNNRSNDFQLNQTYLVIEKTLEHEGQANFGFRVDFLAGTDAPFIVSNGLFDSVVNEDKRGDHIGIDLPQFYVEAHLPILTEGGVDIRAGKFYTYHGNELTPAPQTNFYSHSYGFFYAWPFTHTGVAATVHLTDTVDVMNAIVRGWDVFDDNNDKVSWHGMVLWTSCDKNSSFWFTWITGPEQVGNNDNDRTLITYDWSHKFGSCNQWQIVLHGANAWEDNAANGGTEDAEWYDYAVNVFYTVNPRLILGARAEWFRDDDGVRTAFGPPFNRPGFADNFYEITLGLTYKPYQNLRIRPEIRFDWADQTLPYNDLLDDNQQTAAIDFIWEF